MTKFMSTACAIALALAVGGCGDDGDDGITVEPVRSELADIQARVFTPTCAGFTACHDANAPAAALDLTDGRSHAALVDRMSTVAPDRILVVPGDPEASFLVDKLRGTLAEGEGQLMPYGNMPLDDQAIEAIEEWIAAGAAP